MIVVKMMAAVIVLVLCAPPASAAAVGPIAASDSIVSVGSPTGDRWRQYLPQSHDENGMRTGMSDLMLGSPSVGFYYRQTNFIIPALWTSGGQWVLHRSSWYIPIGSIDDVDRVAEITGLPKDELVVPFSYRVPMGLFFVVLILTICVLFAYVKNTVKSYAKWKGGYSAARDPVYCEAMRRCNGPGGLNDGVDWLVSQGIPVSEAHEKLRSALMQTNHAEIRRKSGP